MPYINTEHLFQCNTCRYHNKSGCATLCDHGEQYIPDMKKIPEAEVEEVRHAHWEYNRHQAPHEKSYFCSLCAEGESDYGMDKYCSRCGAKMDGGKNENL